MILAAVAILASISVTSFVLGRRAVRSVRRRVSGASERARLMARAHGVGPAAEVARLRRDMTRTLAGAHRALDAAQAVDSPVGDVPALLARLELAAHAVDGELRVLEAQPERSRIVTRLAGPRSRAEAISSSAYQLVEGLLHAAGHRAEDLGLLQAACALEADALRCGARAGGPAPYREAPR